MNDDVSKKRVAERDARSAKWIYRLWMLFLWFMLFSGILLLAAGAHRQNQRAAALKQPVGAVRAGSNGHAPVAAV